MKDDRITFNFTEQSDFDFYTFKSSVNGQGRQAEFKFENGLIWDALKMSKNLKPINWKEPVTSRENILAKKSPLQRSILKSGRSKIKKNRGYCTELAFVPSGPEFHMKISFDLINAEHRLVKRKTVKHVFIDEFCVANEAEFKKKYDGSFECVAENTQKKLNLKVYTEQIEYAEIVIEIYRGSKVHLESITFEDCSLEPKLRGKSGEALATATTTSTTTTTIKKTTTTSTSTTTTTTRDCLKYLLISPQSTDFETRKKYNNHHFCDFHHHQNPHHHNHYHHNNIFQ